MLHSGKTLLELLFEIRLVKSYMKGMISSFPRNMFAPISVLSIFSSSILMAIPSFFLIITPATKSEITAASSSLRGNAFLVMMKIVVGESNLRFSRAFVLFFSFPICFIVSVK